MTTKNVNPSGAKIEACESDASCASIACEICLAEIPATVAHSMEGPDYVHHFCGLNCLEQWQKKAHGEFATPKK